MNKGIDAGIQTLHYSSEFFKKYKDIINGGDIKDNDREELSAKLIGDIVKEMRDAIKSGDKSKMNFKLFKFENGKTSTAKADSHFSPPATYSNTDLQDECITNGINAIKSGKTNLLMAAVMRFGKTHASYEIVKQAGLKKVIVVSAKALTC